VLSRFPPWTTEDNGACVIVKDRNSQARSPTQPKAEAREEIDPNNHETSLPPKRPLRPAPHKAKFHTVIAE
jgi:hypothetical protein